MPALEENTTNGDQSKKKRVQLKHLLLDCDFFDKPKIVALQYRFTPLGVGALIHILSAMSKGTNGEIPVDCALAILDRHGVPEKDKFIPYCLGLGILHAGSSELFISNCRVVEDQEAMAKNQDKWRNKKRQQRDKEGTPPESLNIEDLKNEDLKDPKRGVQGGGDCTGAKIPAALNTPEVAQAVGRWRAHLLKNHNRVFDAIAEESLYASYATRREELIRNIEWSVQNGWKTINAAPPKQLPEAEKIRIAAEARAKATMPNEPPRPKPKPIVPCSDVIEPIRPETLAECKRKIQEITRAATPKVSLGNA